SRMSPPPPDQTPAIARPCPAQFAAIRALDPRTIFACAPALSDPARRDFLLREAYLREPAAALPFLDSIADRPWVGEIPFSRAISLMGDRPTPAREKVLLASALANPSLALRELLTNLDLPFAARLLEPVILIVPAETVAIASGASRNATRIRSYLE